MTSEEDTAAAGMRRAKDAIHAIADGNDQEALSILNGASHPEAVWAAAYLLSALRESMGARFERPGQLRAALHKAARDSEDDLMTQVAIIIEREGRDHE